MMSTECSTEYPFEILTDEYLSALLGRNRFAVQYGPVDDYSCCPRKVTIRLEKREGSRPKDVDLNANQAREFNLTEYRTIRGLVPETINSVTPKSGERYAIYLNGNNRWEVIPLTRC